MIIFLGSSTEENSETVVSEFMGAMKKIDREVMAEKINPEDLTVMEKLKDKDANMIEKILEITNITKLVPEALSIKETGYYVYELAEDAANYYMQWLKLKK